MGKKLAFWGDCNGYGYKIIKILEELGGINVSNYGANEVTSLYYIDEKNNIKGTYNGDLDKEKYVVMTYYDFIAKYPHQVHDIVYSTDNHEEGEVVEIVWDETIGRMRYLVVFENSTSWVFVDDIFSYEAKDNSECDTAIKPMKVKSNTVKLVDDKVVDNLDKEKTMNKKLAIEGHSTRGKEVIELLEMMGGSNIHNLSGNDSYAYYIIEGFKSEIRGGLYIFGDEDMYFFTLEEFLEKYPFKVGDKVVYTKFGDNCDDYPVTIESMKWTGTTIEYTFNDCVTCLTKDIKMWNKVPTNEESDDIKPGNSKCERTHEDVIFDSIIWHLRNSVNNGKQNLSGGECEDYFRELVKKNNENKMSDCKKCGLGFGSVRCFDKDCPHNTPKSYAVGLKDGKVIDNLIHKDIDMNTCKDTARDVHKKIAYLSINNEDYAEQIEINLGDNYEYKFEMNRLYIVKKKPKYPTSYEECCEVIGISCHDVEIDLPQPYQQKMFNLFKLRICRDAYWKIAGDEMGLGKPWEPLDANDKYIIRRAGDTIVKGYDISCVLEFPTAKIRNSFYENFKDLIECCKEML